MNTPAQGSPAQGSPAQGSPAQDSPILTAGEQRPTDKHLRRFQRFSIAAVLYTIGVIMFGAWVRVTGSGAGCGRSWPTCHGSAIPRTDAIETVIEFTHRITSGVSLVLVLIMLWLAIRWFPKGHLARKWSKISVFFMVTEALLGAGLVLFELVVDNDSVFRAFSMTAHLVNTSVLMASMVCATYWGGIKDPRPERIPAPLRTGLILGMFALLLTSMTGAITALGDTLYPATSSSEAISSGLRATSHFLVRLRLLHPVIALGAGALVAIMSAGAGIRAEYPSTRTWAYTCTALVIAQVTFGFVNIALSAPAWMQLVHLGMATTLWCCYISLMLHLRHLPTLVRDTPVSSQATV